MSVTVLGLALVLAGAPAAQPDAPPAATPPPSSAEDRFREGLRAYDAQDYRRAIEAFQDAYRASAKPEILFNIAQAYRLLGDCSRAVENLDAFMAAVPASDPLLPRARARRQELDSCVTADTPAAAPGSAKLAPAPPAPPAPPPPIIGRDGRPDVVARSAGGVPPPARPPSRAGQTLRTACIGTAGGGLVLAGVGLGLGAWARSAEHEVESSPVWDAEAERADERGRVLGRAATALFVSAGITTAVAVTTCLLGWRTGR